MVATKVYSGLGADFVMESISLIENWPVRVNGECNGDFSTTTLYDSRKSIMTGADRNQFVLNPT